MQGKQNYLKEKVNELPVPSSFLHGFSFGLFSHFLMSRFTPLRRFVDAKTYMSSFWRSRGLTWSAISGFAWTYASFWQQRVDEDIRAAPLSSSEFEACIYEYGNDDHRLVGIDLVKFYELKLQNNKTKSNHTASPAPSLNFLERLTLRAINFKVNLKLKYNMQEQYDMLPEGLNVPEGANE